MLAGSQAFDSDVQQGRAACEIGPRFTDNCPISQFFDNCCGVASGAGAGENLMVSPASPAAVRMSSTGETV